MRKVTLIFCIAMLAACGSKVDNKTNVQRHTRAPVALDPHPPMSASDIDAIVNQGKHKPATTANSVKPTSTPAN